MRNTSDGRGVDWHPRTAQAGDRPLLAAALAEALRAVPVPPEVLLRLVADRIAARVGRDHHLPAHWAAPEPDGGHSIPRLSDDQLTPALLGQVREWLHPEAARTALGAWFTPPALAEELVDLALASHPAPRSVLDPACGGGAFLLAAHAARAHVHLVGVDIDPLAVEVTRAALHLAGCTDHDVRIADGLSRHPAEYDLVVGNPPFLSQLHAGTARDGGRRAALASRFGAVATGYVDEAALFVLATATELLAEGGVGVLVVPEALLATADGAAVRSAVSRRCEVEVVWRDLDGVFPHTPTCAIRLTRLPTPSPGSGSVPARIPLPHPLPAACRATTATPNQADTPPRGSGAWSHLLATDVPIVSLSDILSTIGEVATASADFRDAHYLLADHVTEQTTVLDGGEGIGHRIVTVGLIDPAHLRWGEVEMRFAKQRWRRPVAIDLPTAFLDRRLGPKVLVATQSKVLEALVDERGTLVPSTPVITVRTDRPWHVGAALTSPVLTAIAARRHAGAARSRGALKLSARQILELPLPAGPSPAWDEGATAYRSAHDTDDPVRRAGLLLDCGRAMAEAYGLEDEALVAWWRDRLPSRPPPG